MGEAGVGKTRLLRELWEWCGTEAPDALRRTGRCAPYGPARTYQPLAEIIKEHFGILDSDSPERVLTLLGERKILALALGLDLARGVHPIEARDRLHDAWIELVGEIAAQEPLALLVEDVHCAEEPLLEQLVTAEAPTPVRDLLGRAEGNPLFLEELLGTLIERGALHGDRWDEELVPGET